MLRKSFIIIIMLLGMGISGAFADQTPPMLPKIQEAPLPPPVELSAPTNTPSDLPNRPLTADEAALIAMHHQPSVANAVGVLTTAQGKTRQARAGQLPSVVLGGGYSNVNTLSLAPGATAGGTPGVSATGFQVGVSVRQLVFDFNHTRDLVAQAVASERSANANLSKVQSDLVLQVKLAFYTYAQNLRLVSVNEGNYKNQENHLALAEARLKAGVGLPSDVVRAQTAVADAVFSLNLAQNIASVSRVNLAQLMGIDPRTPVQIKEASECSMPEESVESLVNQALKQRPDMLQARENVLSARQGVNAAKTSNAPSLVVTAGWAENSREFPLENESLSAGVGVVWDLFDSGLTSGGVKAAKGNLKSADAQLASVRLTVISDVSQAYLNLKTSEQRLVTAQAEVANAKEGVRLSEGRYRTGLGTFLDVVDAQTALLTADTNRVNAQSSIDQARASLAHATGIWKVCGS